METKEKAKNEAVKENRETKAAKQEKGSAAKASSYRKRKPLL
ncbi:MAG TPA: hypothetical protein VIM77_10010 [Mucilaginibacter sp.]